MANQWNKGILNLENETVKFIHSEDILDKHPKVSYFLGLES
jgi:hypothetical protein